MDWTCCEFRHLSSNELYLILRVRNAVLVVEDAHTFLDIDGKDESAVHVFATDRSGARPAIAAYARLLPGDEIDPETTIDKWLTSAAHRDDGTAAALAEHALAAAHARWPEAPVRTQAPAHREAFFVGFGFRKADGPFLEHGAPYIGMVRPVGGAARSVRTLIRRASRAAGADAHGDAERYVFSNRLSADSGANQ
ncbi:drug:proton antiporter [Burkholderia sp. FERM BP-3421]|jgi:predicted GNAT family N-acyltransferase|uniref:drug:proton antiporter n=1 Tax=Burkholderia sp. FERM BP-3421 TaxID=1494466 RepID=UPI0023623186|nr:drug:proton antiporter [Burkholderia sp. FERM BP-3421]WDD95311.1 drug:proton antiporter [Burkholderia sp. FERM BP-3421]